MKRRERFHANVGVLLGTVLLCLALPWKAAAQCPWCTSPTTCALVNEGTDTSKCQVTANEGCSTTSGLCVFVRMSAETARDLHLDRASYRTVGGQDGKVELAPVGPSRFAAWNCQGELVRLYEERSGRMVKLNHLPYREEYAYERLVREAARKAIA